MNMSYQTNKEKKPTTNYSSSFMNPQRETEQYDIDSINRSVNNAQTRIQDAGYQVEDADNRNWFEKATNLPQKQNWFFDSLELLERPMQGILNPVNKSLQGREQNVLDSAWKGFSGQQEVRGSEMAENLGIENKAGKFATGLGIEVLTDPLTYVPGGALLKGAKAVGKPIGKGAQKSYLALENLSPKLKQAREEVIKPTYTSAKDGLGYMFNPDYKARETLFGGQSDDLVNSFQRSENLRRFQQEDFTNRLADTAKTTGLEGGTDVGRAMERNLKQFDEAGNELPRPQRGISNDPNVTKAAEDLMRSNAEIRELARREGISIPELEGYMTHILSKSERATRRKNGVLNIDRGSFGQGQPNKKILNQRKLSGSVEDVNEEVGREFFEPNAYFATAIGQRRLIDYIQAASFRKNVLTNSDFAVKYERGMEVPNNAVVIDSNNYKFINEGEEALLGEATEEVGGRYVVTKAAKEKLDKYKQAMTDEGSRSFLRSFDQAQSFWKRAALFSIPYHMRNDIGAKFNNWVGGMSGVDLAKYSADADQAVWNAMVKGNESALYREYRQQGLGATSQSAVEFAQAGVEPEKAVEKIVKYKTLDKTGKAKYRANPLNWFESSRQFGDFVDQTNRFAAYKWAREKLKLDPEQAAAKARELQFDYTKTTNFEKNFMVRAMPFYRWMRNNLPFQIRNFINDPRKYVGLDKARRNAQEVAGVDDENIPDWMKENFYFPLTSDGKGKGKMLGFNLPAGDLARLSTPLKMGVESATPLAKLPLELATNRNLFYDKPIKEFEGQQRQLQIPFTDKKFGLPVTPAYALEQATGQIGRGAFKTLTPPDEVNQDTKFRMPTLGISGVLKDYDAEQGKFFEEFERLRALQDYIDYIEQQTGQRPRTMNEINRAGR